MDEEVINDLYNRAVSKGYKKDRNAFVDLLHTDSEVFNDMYSYVQSKGYKKSTKDFEYLVGVKKKESTVSPSKGGTSVLPKTKADAIAESKSLGTPTGEYTYSPESFDKEVPLAPQSRANKPIVPQPTVKPKEEFVYYEPDIYSEEVLAPKSRANKPKAEIEGKPTISNDEFNRRISTITPELTSKEEEFTVPQLNYQFKDFGFTFEETGLGDAVSVTAPNGKKTIISLGKTADRDLQKFLKDNANQYDKLSKSITNQENYNKTFTDQKEIESSFVKIQQDQNDFTQSVQELYKIPKDSEEYKVKLAELQKKQTQIEGSKKDLNKSVGKYVAMKSTQGETSEYLYNQLLEGLTGAASGTAGLMIDAFAPSNMTDAEKKAAKKWIQPILRESLDFAKSESVTKEYAANVGFIEGAVGGLVKSLPAMLAAEAMPLVMAAQISDDLDVQMESDPNFKNISENEKLFLKVPMMVGGAVLETYGFRNAIGTKGLLNDLVASAIGKSTKSTTTKTFKEFIEQDIESRIAKGAIKIGAGGLAEFETGASQELLDITTKDIYNAAKGKDMFQTPNTFGEGAKQVIKAGLQEAIGGFILSTPSAFQKAKANNDYTELTDGQVEVLKNLGNDVNVMTAIEADLQNKVNLGDLTPKEAEEQLNDTRETVGVMNSIDTEELSNDQIKEALPIVDEIKKLEQQKEGKIPIQKKIIQAKIDELNAKLLKVTGNEDILEPTKKENDATKISSPTKMDVGKQPENGEGMGEGNAKEQATPETSSVGVGGDVEIKNEGKADAPTKESVTERLNINNPFYKKVEDALVKLGLIEKYNAETGTGDVVGGYAQQTSDGGFSVGKMLFSQDGSISYFDGDVKVSFDKNGNVISENTKEAKQKANVLAIESKKESIDNLEKTRDSEAFKYKEVTETDILGNKKKVKRLKTEQELKDSTDKINAAIDKAKAELSNLEQSLKETTKSETPTTNTGVEEGSGVGGDVEAKINKVADEYLYHGTGEGAFRRIREEGLTPQGEKYLYFADKEQYAKTYAQRKGNSFGDRVLRVKKSDAYLPDENTTGGDFKIKNKINPNDIEIKHNGKWIPIQEFADENIGIMPISKAVEQYLKETPKEEVKPKSGSVGVGGDVEVVNIGGKPFNGTTLSTGKNPFEVNSKNEVEVADKKRAMASINGALPRLYDWKEYPNDGLSSIAVIKKPIVSFDSNGEVVVERKGEIVFDAELKSKEQATPEASTEKEVTPVRVNGTNAIDNKGNVSKEFSDKIELLKENKDKEGLNEIYSTIKILLNGVAQSKGENTVKALETIKSDLENFAKQEVKPTTNKTNGSKTEKTKTKTDEAKVLIEEPKSAVVETAAEEVKPIEDNIYLPKEDKTHNISIAKKMLTDLGINAEFSGYSDTNGVSVYFTNENGEKIRISDHSVTNKDRIQNEILLNFDTKTLGVGGKIGLKSNFESNKIKVQDLKSQPQVQEPIIAETKTTVNKETPKPKSIEAIEIEKQIAAAQNEVTTLNDKIKTKAAEMGKTYMEDQSNLFGERKSEENVLFSQRVNPDQINKVLGDLKAKRDAAIKNVRSLKEKLAKVEKEGSIQQDMFGYNPEPKKKPTILDNTKKKYAKLDELSPRTLLLRFFATGGKISSEEGMKRTKLGMKDLWGKVAKKGTTYHNLYQNITDELGMELGDIDQLEFDNMVDEFLRGNKSDIFKEINTHLGEKEKVEEIADPTNFTYEELQAELKNIDPYYHDYLLEQIGEQESLIQDELSETELAELDKNIEKYTVNGTIDWEAIANDKEVQQLESNTNGKQDTKTESTTKRDSTPISKKEKTGQGGEKVTPETIIENATLPKKFRYNVKSWAAVSRKFGFEPYIKDGKMIFKVATGEIHEMPLKEGENIERWREDYNSYIDGLKVGDTIKYKNYGSEETGVIRKVNKNREGKVSSVSTENHTISPDNIRSEIYSPEGMLGRDVRDVGMSWYSGLDKYKQPKYDNLLKLSESKSDVSDKDVSTITAKEKAKQRVEKAKEAFKKASKDKLSLGGLETLPEFTELVLAYIELGYVTAKDIISKIGEDLEGFDFDEKIATDKINAILKVNKDADKIIEETEKEPKKVKKTVSTIRAYEGDIREGVKRELEKLGLTREIESQSVAKAKAKAFVESVGEEDALNAVRKNDVEGASAAYIWDDALQSLGNKLLIEKNPDEVDRLEKLQAKLFNEFEIKARKAGQFSSALNDIYQSSETIAYNVEKRIQTYKDANNGEISPEVEAKFRELDRQLQDVKKRLAEAEQRAKKAEDEATIKIIQEAAERESKQKTSTKIRKDTDWIVLKVKEAKIHRPNMFSSATPASLVWDGAVETVAAAIKITGRSAEAIAKGVEYVRNSDWYNNLNREDKKTTLKQFNDFWKGSQPRVEEGKIKIPDSLIQDLVAQGANTIEQLVSEVKEIMIENYPNITDREIRDAITQYGKIKNLNKDEIAAEIRKIKRIGRIISALEDVNAKKRPLRSGIQRDKLDADERALNKELREAMKELPIDEALEEEQQKNATDAAKTRILNQIEDLQREIDKGELVPRKVRTIKDDAELTNLKAKRDALKAEHEAIFKDEEFRQAKRLELTKRNTQKRIEDLQRRIKEGDFSKKARTPLIKDSELLKLRAEKLRIQDEYDKELYKVQLKNRTKFKKTIDSLWELWGIPRILMATGEASFILIQGAKIGIAHPIYAAKAFKQSWKAFKSEKYTEQFLRDIKAQDYYPVMKDSKLALTEPKAELLAREELFYSGWTNMIWDNLGKIILSPTRFKDKATFDRAASVWSDLNPFKAVERASIGYLDTIRVLRFLDGMNILETQGKTFESNPQDYKDVANAINTLTGRASLGKAEQFAATLSKVFFSPRNWASGIKTATPYALYHFGKMTPTARKMAISDLSKYVGLTTTMVMLAAAYLNDDDDEETSVELDPRSSDFMKIKLGNTRVDPWGGMQQQIVLSSRLIAEALYMGLPEGQIQGSYKKKGEVMPLGLERQTPTALKLMGQQAVNKLNPTASVLYNYLSAKRKTDGTLVDEYYNPLTLKGEFQDKFNPIFWSTVDELLKEDPTALDGLLTFYAFLGGGVNVYDKPKSKSNTPKKITPRKRTNE